MYAETILEPGKLDSPEVMSMSPSYATGPAGSHAGDEGDELIVAAGGIPTATGTRREALPTPARAATGDPCTVADLLRPVIRDIEVIGEHAI